MPRPTIGLAIAGTDVPASHEGSYCQSTACSGACADRLAPTAPLTVVRASPPVRLDFSAGAEVTAIGGNVWTGETIAGTPIESFILGPGQRSYTSTKMSGGRYYIAVRLRWSRPLDGGDTSRAFQIEIIPP
jgi:hypothetical protein